MNPFEDIDAPTEDEIEEMRAKIEQQKENWDPLDLPESQAQLVMDIRAAGGPDEMVTRTGAGVYHDYASPLPMPKQQLVADAQAHGLHEIAQRAKRGYYDP
jgi:protein subunit release factor A